jgi:hypothetical protein
MAGTIGFDTFTQVRQLIDSVKLEEVRERVKNTRKQDANGDVRLFPFDYSEANIWTSDFARRPNTVPGVNMVLVHRSTAVYDANGNMTDNLKLQGWGEVQSAVGLTLRTAFNRDNKSQKFEARIENCGSDPLMEGQWIRDVDYENILAFLGLEEGVRITCAPWGPTKSGKSHLMFTFPKPLIIYDLDFRVEFVLPKFCEMGKEEPTPETDPLPGFQYPVKAEHGGGIVIRRPLFIPAEAKEHRGILSRLQKQYHQDLEFLRTAGNAA